MEQFFTMPQIFAVLFHSVLGVGILIILADYLPLKIETDHPDKFIESPKFFQSVLLNDKERGLSSNGMENGTNISRIENETGGDFEFESWNEETSIYGGDAVYGDSQYFFSVSQVQRLSRMEQELIPWLFKSLKRLESLKASSNRNKRFQILSYLRDYQESVFPSKTADLHIQQGLLTYSPPKIFGTERDLENATKIISLHPLKVFRLLRRLFYDFSKILNLFPLRKELVTISKKVTPPIHLEELDGAADGILRIQEAYKISTSDITKGKLVDLETDSGLSALDVHYVGKRALATKRFTQGLLWLRQAYLMATQGKDTSVKPEVVKADLRVGIYMHNSYKKIPAHSEYTFSSVLSFDLEQLDALELFEESVGFGSFKTLKKNKFDTATFHSLCRGEVIRAPVFTKNLKCWYKRDNPWLLIKPLKVEMHNEVAGLVQFYDILPVHLISHLKDQAGARLKRAGVVGLVKNKKPLLSYGRISNSAWINESMSPILLKIPKIIKEATGLDAKTGISAEHSQVSCYGPIGGFYDTHFDSYYQLNSVRTGGGAGTAFPRLGVLAQPIKGSALFWFNLSKNGEENELMLHGGCPLLYGEKWGNSLFLNINTFD